MMPFVAECAFAKFVQLVVVDVCRVQFVQLKFVQVHTSSFKFVQLVQFLFIMLFIASCRVSVSGDLSSSDNMSGSLSSSAAMSEAA